MSINVNTFLSKNTMFIAFGLIVLVGLGSVACWKHKQSQQDELIKLESERKRISIAFQQAGINAAKLQQKAQSKQTLQEDALAPHELSGDAELALAKLWQSLPKDKRAIMQEETIKAGLAAANKEQFTP